jgi:glycosyltransferase involved in cell wall biosynthesis
MRLLLVVSEMGVGGAERVVVDLATDAARRGDAVALLADPGRFDAHLEGLHITRGPLPPGRAPAALLRSTASARQLIRDFRPDVIHTHNVRVTGLARIASELARPRRRPPIIATYHGVPAGEVKAAGRVLRLADAVVCVSAGLREQLEAAGAPPRLLSVIPNGVANAAPLSAQRQLEIDAELGLDGSPVVSIVGRLVTQKAHDRFLRAALVVAQRLPSARFLIVGDGPLRDELERMAADLGVAHQTRFTGVRDDAPYLIARSDLLTFSSDWEGLSIAALEALAAGVPVVSTDVAGMRELLSSGAGAIVPHDAEALGAAIADLLLDGSRLAGMGAEARRLHRERFSTESMTSAYRALYDRMAADRPVRSRR